MKSIPEASVDTRLLAERLRKLNPGDTVTYDELGTVVGRDVRTRAAASLYSARRIALREGIVTEAVTRVGIKRLTDGEIVSTVGPRQREHIRRTSKRGVQKLAAVDYAALAPAQQIKHNTEVSLLGAMQAFSRESSARRIEAKVTAGGNKPLAIANTIKAFSD